jgi:hypothetical protein
MINVYVTHNQKKPNAAYFDVQLTFDKTLQGHVCALRRMSNMVQSQFLAAHHSQMKSRPLAILLGVYVI